jgi:ketosteroid isomerase-like protein
MKRPGSLYFPGIFVILILPVLTSCQTKGSTGDTETEKAVIKKMAGQLLSGVTGLTKDNAAGLVKTFYSEDAVIFPPNAPPVRGQKAITEMLRNYPPMTDYLQKPEEIIVSGNYAYQWDTWSVTLPLSDKTAFKDKGTIFWIWHKQDDGKWKLLREIWHSDIPVPGISPAPPA